ncbi:Crp/Fnr family transcriptional regulator [Reichenbachiella sp. MALMAid0571]|uniref:Crp/Fnr family transcriptional regulator n=1 Tax=Reichenbachiella sp. MALMAid0571 TaxID=3143939 RepID=UPI0032E02867
MKEILKEKFRNILQPELIDEMADKGRLMSVTEGKIMIDYGKYIKEIPMVLSGSVRIIREDDKGNELFLYYLGERDTCAMSLTCCTQHKKSEIKAIAETDTEVWMIPLQYMDLWMKYSTWRQFIFNSYNLRFEELINALDSVAFLRMDERLMNYLLDIKQNTGSFTISKTHQEIATEMNTSRVVVSRLLKKLENEDKIVLHRNKIEIL